jgi:DNA invertase Pin-like site-specific DNA recombinase
MTSIAAYSRISVSSDTSTSIAAQQQLLDARAVEYGLPVVHYVDDGFSGSKAVERPAYERMVLAIEAGEHSVLLVKSIDRLGRRLVNFTALVALATAHGCRIVAIEQGLDTGTPNGRLFLNVLSSFAEFEAEAIGLRQAVGQAYRREQGRAIGAAPFGFSNVAKADGSWRVINDPEAALIRRAYNSVLHGQSLRSITDDWASEGILTRQGFKWSAGGLSQTLSNPSIVGQRKYKDTVMKGPDGLPITDSHLQILSLPEWSKLHETLSARAVFWKGESHDRLLLHGLARCGSCGGLLTRSSVTAYLRPGVKSGRKFPMYSCGAGTHRKCDKPVSIGALRLDTYVMGQAALLPDSVAPIQVTVLSPENSTERVLLAGEISALSASLATSSVEDTPAIIERLVEFKARLGTLPTEVRQVKTFFADRSIKEWLVTDPAYALTALFSAVVVHPAASTRGPVADRVVLSRRSGVTNLTETPASTL